MVVIFLINWDKYDEELLLTIQNYVADYEKMDDEAIQELIDDVLLAVENYHFKYYNEYFKYQFNKIPVENRASFFGISEYTKCVKNSMQGAKNTSPIFKNKMLTYNTFKDYYKRDIIEVKDFNDYSKFVEFATKHSSFIVKETEGSLGANISKVTITENTPIKTAFFRILQYGGCVCEPWIEQSEEFARLNDSSVNTIRIATVYDERGLTKMYGMLRTGRNGNVVDNASNGGIAAEIDLDTGIVISDGYTKTHLEHFECHPDTGVRYKGFQIPRWNEVLPMVEEMHKICPVSKLVGWDLALTNDGWVLIEGNGKPNIDTIQMIHYNTFGRGLRDVIENAMGKYRP